jgi:hypothetical protein
MELGPTGQVTLEERVIFLLERNSSPDGGQPLLPPGCTELTHSRPFLCRRNCIAKTQTQTCVTCGVFPFMATPHIWLQPFRSGESYQAGPSCAPSIPLVAHGFTTTQPPLAQRLAAERASRACALRACASRHILLNPPKGLTAVPQPAWRRPRIRLSPSPQHIPILAPRSGQWCLRQHFQPAFEAHPARLALSTAHSAYSACLPLHWQ